jgi:TolB-like protein/tetratricopeptide (TPR) repeat protein
MAPARDPIIAARGYANAMSDEASKVRHWLAELRRRKVFRVAAVYLVVAWLLVQVAGTIFEPMGLPPWTLKLVITLAALGFPLACALAWAFDVTAKGIERTPDAAPLPDVAFAPPDPKAVPAAAGAQGSTAVPAAQALPATGTAAAEAPDSVAILPFVDMSPARDQEYFCDGIAEEIINALCCIRDLRIASRTSSFQFKGRATDVREIGRTLGVGAVLEGSVRKAGERVRITAQLVSSADGYHLWSESYDRELCDVFAIQTEIAQKMVQALRVSLSRQERELIQRRGTSNGEAYDLYLRGQAHLRDGTDTAMGPAIGFFREAVRRDGRFAQAHAGIAHAQSLKGLWRVGMTQADFDEAFAASQRALELEPRMPEAYVARAMLLSLQGRTREADQDFEEAIRLNPASFEAHYSYARHCFQSGEFARAVSLYEAAIRLRPDDYQALCLLEGALLKLGRLEEHADVARRAMQALERQLAIDPRDGRALQLGTVQAARLGLRDNARELAKRALQARPDAFSTFYNVACAYSVLGDVDDAIAMLDQAVQHGRGNLEWIERDPDFDPLRADPRFNAIVNRLRSLSAGATSA